VAEYDGGAKRLPELAEKRMYDEGIRVKIQINGTKRYNVPENE
jgi:hypothetical protein